MIDEDVAAWSRYAREPRGSAQCPRCGKFRRIVDDVDHRLLAVEDAFCVIECPDHGRRAV